MGKVLSWVVVIGGLLAVILIALANLKQAAAERAYAHAYVIQAQGQARLDTLTRIASIIGAAFPLVLVLAVVIVAVYMVIFFVIWLREIADSRAYKLAMMRQQQPRIIKRIETRIVLMIPPPDVSRREFYQLMLEAAHGAEIRQLTVGRDYGTN